MTISTEELGAVPDDDAVHKVLQSLVATCYEQCHPADRLVGDISLDGEGKVGALTLTVDDQEVPASPDLMRMLEAGAAPLAQLSVAGQPLSLGFTADQREVTLDPRFG